MSGRSSGSEDDELDRLEARWQARSLIDFFRNPESAGPGVGTSNNERGTSLNGRHDQHAAGPPRWSDGVSLLRMDEAMVRELQQCRSQVNYLQLREQELMEYVCQLQVRRGEAASDGGSARACAHACVFVFVMLVIGMSCGHRYLLCI